MKICSNCNRTYSDPDAYFCEECEGMKLVEMDSNVSPSTPYAGYAPDNSIRYHKGDKTTIGGDNISNEHIDNRNIVNTSNTTVNQHIQQTIVDSSKEFVVCAISGMRVLEVQTAVCPKCKRIVSLQLYVMSEFCCKDCASALKKEVHPIAKDIPPLIADVNVTPLSKPIVEPIHNVPINTKPNTFIKIGIAVFVILLIGGGFYVIKNVGTDLGSQKMVVGETKTDEPSTAVELRNEPIIANTVSKPKADAKTADSRSDSKTNLTEVVPPNPFVEGETAYQAGNYSRASLFFKEAAQIGNAGANYYLSQMHSQGQGTNKNIKEAFSYMLKAAEGGFSEAYYELAEMYRKGVGVEMNRANAQKWYEKAAMSNASNSEKADAALRKFFR